MKNLISLSILAVLLIFTSCSQSDQFEAEPTSTNTLTIAERSMRLANNNNNNNNKNSSSKQVEVAKTSLLVVGSELLLDFHTTSDFTSTILEAVQVLEFLDSAGNTVSLNFVVNTFSYANNLLEVSFDLGTHDLTGLQIKTMQDIIIQDMIID